MKLFSEYARLLCEGCGWIGEISQCQVKEMFTNAECPVSYLCPRCQKRLAINGWLGIYSDEINATALDDGRVEH